MKWVKLFVMPVLICLMLAACGSGKPSKKQVESDIQASGIVNFPIDEIRIVEDGGDKQDYYANVTLSGSEGVFSYGANAYVKYGRSGSEWYLTDCGLSSDIKTVIERAPTEQEIISGFAGLKPLEFYLPYSTYFEAREIADEEKSNGLSFESQFDNIIVSNISMDSSRSEPSISFEVSCTETYHGVTAAETFYMRYNYYAQYSDWWTWGRAECTDIDYSGLVGRTVRNHDMEGYIDSFSADGFTLVIGGETYGFAVEEKYQDLAGQFEHLHFRNSILGADRILYESSYNDLYYERFRANASEARFALQDMTITLDTGGMWSMNQMGLNPLEISE